MTISRERFLRGREKASDTMCRRCYPVCKATAELYATGLRQREVATKLGISVSAVKRRLRRYWELVDRFEEVTE